MDQLVFELRSQVEKLQLQNSEQAKIIEEQQRKLFDIHESTILCNKTLAHVLGKLEPNLVLSVQKAATNLSAQRQYALWCAEERSKLNRRIAMLEAAIEASLTDLKLRKASGGTIQHYERILRNDWSFLGETE